MRATEKVARIVPIWAGVPRLVTNRAAVQSACGAGLILRSRRQPDSQTRANRGSAHRSMIRPIPSRRGTSICSCPVTRVPSPTDSNRTSPSPFQNPRRSQATRCGSAAVIRAMSGIGDLRIGTFVQPSSRRVASRNAGKRRGQSDGVLKNSWTASEDSAVGTSNSSRMVTDRILVSLAGKANSSATWWRQMNRPRFTSDGRFCEHLVACRDRVTC